MKRERRPQGEDSRGRIYDFIDSFTSEHGFSPTMRDIANGLDMVPSQVRTHILILEEDGEIIREPGRARTIRTVRR